jgi:hypothetical protein
MAFYKKTPSKMYCTPIVRHHLTIGGPFLMAKITVEQKLNAVKSYLNGNESQQRGTQIRTSNMD